MRATINGIQVEGTPEEIAALWREMGLAKEPAEPRDSMPEPMQQSEARCFPSREVIAWNGPLDHQGRPITHWGGNTAARTRGVYMEPQQHQPAHPLNGGVY